MKKFSIVLLLFTSIFFISGLNNKVFALSTSESESLSNSDYFEDLIKEVETKYSIDLNNLNLTHNSLSSIDINKHFFTLKFTKTEDEIRAEILKLGQTKNEAPISSPLISYSSSYDDNYSDGKEQCTVNFLGHQITIAQKALVLKYPIQAFNAFVASKVANTTTKYLYGFNGHNDKTDAFRHAYWNALMVKRIGFDLAEKFGDAHEDKPIGCQPYIETEMDLFNNRVGRNYANQEGTHTVKILFGIPITMVHTDDELARIIKSHVSNGDMKYIKDGQLVDTNI